MNKTEIFFPPDHPCGAGHFPGNPIIPGALLLSATVRAIEVEMGLDFSSCQIKSAKFFHPARPGDSVAIEFSATPGGINFQGAVGETKVLAGTVHATTAQQ